MDAGTEAGSFLVSAQSSVSIPEGESGTITISFIPALTIGNKSAKISIPTNDLALPLYEIKVTGAGTTIPTGITATSANHQSTLTWPSISSVSSYNLYW